MEAQDSFIKNKNRIINAVIILAGIFFAFKIYNAQIKELTLLKETKENEIKKNVVLNDLGEVVKKYNSYEEFVNRKDPSSVITIVGELAKQSAIEINSIKPSQIENTPFFSKYFFDLKLTSNGYHSVGEFIARLESNPAIFSVEMITISPREGQRSQTTDKVNVDLKISTILLKNEKQKTN